MKTLTLKRTYFPDRTEGKLYDGDNFLIDILERPWLDDIPNISCIPETGTLRQTDVYCFDFHDSVRLPFCWEAINMQDGRNGICIHSANYVWQIEGCLATGMEFGRIGNNNAVLESVSALNYLREYIGKDENGNLLPFQLAISKM